MCSAVLSTKKLDTRASVGVGWQLGIAHLSKDMSHRQGSTEDLPSMSGSDYYMISLLNIYPWGLFVCLKPAIFLGVGCWGDVYSSSIVEIQKYWMVPLSRGTRS